MNRLHYILLTALLMLAACTAEDIPQTGDGMGSAVGGAVKTQFTLSIPGLFNAPTRMAAADVMNETSDFTGMQDIRIFPFVATSKDAEGEYTVTGTTAFSGFTEVGGTADNRIPGFDAEALQHKNVANDKWYTDLSIPSGTNAMLIYGRSLTPATTLPEQEAVSNFTYGNITTGFNLSAEGETPADRISFAHTRIYNNVEDLGTQPEATALITLLNNVIAAQGYETAEGELEAWSNGDNLMTGTYNDFITLKAGCSTHILKALENLYNACAQTTALGLLTAPDGQQTLPEAIQIIIASATSVETTVSGYKLTWKTNPNFPGCYFLPDGAVQLTYTPSVTIGQPGSFAYSTSATIYGTHSLDHRSIVFPASLWYLSNASVRTSEEKQQDNVGTQTWAQFLNSCFSSDSRSVNALTQSIAAVKPLQYAVGRLDSYVHFASGTIFARDPNSPTDDSKQQAVEIPAEGFRITGLLIGDQPSSVDWQFKPSNDATAVTVLDRVMTTMTGATSEDFGTSNTYAQQSAAQSLVPFTRTLLFETKGVAHPEASVTAETNDETVNIAIEMENNSTQAFYGEDGLIPVGGRFYLIASLRLSEKADEANSRGIKSVFKQDYITVVNATIHNLKHAYNTIPNLTVPAQELGISIDLQWEKGVTIETTIK